MPTLSIPPPYRGPTNGQAVVEVPGRTVRECIDAVEARHPGFRDQILDGRGGLHRFVRLFRNGDELAEDPLEQPVSERDHVEVLAAIAGG